ncbi:MAG: hypothetical protein PUI78_08530 [Treponema sp.]|nr:hypothetical protein [Treponema sp.]
MIEENPKIKTIDKKIYPKDNFIKDSAMLHRKQFKNFYRFYIQPENTSSIRQYCCVQYKV